MRCSVQPEKEPKKSDFKCFYGDPYRRASFKHALFELLSCSFSFVFFHAVVLLAAAAWASASTLALKDGARKDDSKPTVLVRISTPVSVTSSVCSNCADSFPSTVTPVQSSGQRSSAYVPFSSNNEPARCQGRGRGNGPESGSGPRGWAGVGAAEMGRGRGAGRGRGCGRGDGLECAPSLIMGSMVKTCPAFITPTALFSASFERSTEAGQSRGHAAWAHKPTRSARTFVVRNVWRGVEEPGSGETPTRPDQPRMHRPPLCPRPTPAPPRALPSALDPHTPSTHV